MSFWIYILRCSDGTYYTGHTDDLERRVAAHQSGAFKGYTSERRPVELMFSENFQTRLGAIDRERQIKDWSRKKKEALFRGDWEGIQKVAGSRPRVSTSLDAGSNQTAMNPVIILVRPQLGRNIGKAARAMLNFGLTELRLVSPRDGWPNPEAGPASSGADMVLEKAKVFDSVAAATADCPHVYATTVRKRGVIKPVMTPAEAAGQIHATSASGRSAILFGPERAGLESDDVALARTIITVPINPAFQSLNLAQAVILVAYEWSKGVQLASPTKTDLGSPAEQSELEGLIVHMEGMLEKAGYFFPPDKVPTTKRMLRTLLTKPGWNAQEVRTMRGVLSAFEKPQKR
jgi:tRNA/rRNA methyltransferase